jgi:hypothetical protein
MGRGQLARSNIITWQPDADPAVIRDALLLRVLKKPGLDAKKDMTVIYVRESSRRLCFKPWREIRHLLVQETASARARNLPTRPADLLDSVDCALPTEY